MEKNQIFKDIIDYFLSMGLPVTNGEEKDGFNVFSSEINRGDIILEILVVFDQGEETVVVSVRFSHGVPPENRPAVIELLNIVHRYLDTGNYVLNLENGQVILKDAIFVVDETLNKKEFNVFFKKIINDAYVFFPLIHEQAHSEKKPEDLVAAFLEKTKPIQK